MIHLLKRSSASLVAISSIDTMTHIDGRLDRLTHSQKGLGNSILPNTSTIPGEKHGKTARFAAHARAVCIFYPLLAPGLLQLLLLITLLPAM
jgi:hypothetical protein